MANLNYQIAQALEELLEMESGYVLNFSNNTFQKFIKRTINIDIYHDIGYEEYCSKAKKLRQLIENESDSKVFKLINELLNYYEDYKLKKDESLTDYEKKKINDIKEYIKVYSPTAHQKVRSNQTLNNLFQEISPRHAAFEEMAIDEKLMQIANLLENQLKQNGKFIKLNYSEILAECLKESDIINFRKKLQCFRHATEESIQERNSYTITQKNFMVEFGVLICDSITKYLEQYHKNKHIS